MNKLVPSPVVFPVAGREYLSKANDDPSSPHEDTMKFVNKIIVNIVGVVVVFAGANGRE